MVKRALVTGAFVSILSTTNAFGWFEFGHKVVCEIAERQLTPAARSQVQTILQGRDMVQLCSWADFVKSSEAWKFSGKWHFIDADPGEKITDGGTPATTKDVMDIVEALHFSEAKITDSQTSTEEKAAYLKLMLHFIGDIHQPMHAGHKSDRGGNDIILSWFGHTKMHETTRSRVDLDKSECSGANLAWDKNLEFCMKSTNSAYGVNLHAVWDGYLLEKFMESKLTPSHQTTDKEDYVGYSNYLMNAFNVVDHQRRGDWNQMSFVDWANESNEAAGLAYSTLPVPNRLTANLYLDVRTGNHTGTPIADLGLPYYSQHIETANRRLAMGGTRLANTLNRIFARPSITGTQP